MAGTARGAARLGDGEVRINRSIAERIRHADAEAAAAALPPVEPLDAPDLVAAPGDVAALRARLRRRADEPQDPSCWRHGPLWPIDPAVDGDEKQGYTQMGFVSGPHPRDAGVRREPTPP